MDDLDFHPDCDRHRATTSSSQNRATAVARHRFGMSCLAPFSWWGAMQGFGPAIPIAIQGDDPSTDADIGNQAGAFSPAFFLFLINWAPFFLLAAYLIRRSTKLRHT